MRIKVSIIVAAYNIEKYIYKCIDSIKNQTFKDIEIIIVNDGSTDKTLNIINNVALEDNRIKIIDKENEGSIEARKSGLNIANGEYILFVDGDDWLELDTLEKLYNNAINNNSDIVIYNAYNSYDDNKIKLNIFNKGSNDDCIKDLFLGNIAPCLWSKFIKLEYIRNNHIEFANNISYAEDLATSASLFIYNPRISYINDYLYNYYQRQESITKTINNKVLEIHEAMRFIKRKLEENKLYTKYKEEYDYMIYNHMIEGHLLKEYYKYEDLAIKLHTQYKSNNINIEKNIYFKKNMSKYKLSQRIRTRAYCKSYNWGKLYDKIRRIKKG